MSQQVLVPIKGHDNIEEILPYLEDIARPDMKIVFLVHFGANRFAELAGQLLEIQSGMPANFSSDTGVPQANLTRRIERASRELSDRGVQIEVKFYSGRLRPLLRQYSEVEGSNLVIMRPGRNRTWRWVQNLFAALRLTKPSPAMPVVLCHPDNIARR
jgi:hypothetical protein